MRFLLSVALLLSVASRQAIAFPFTIDSLITGADMAGMEVEVFYGGTSETSIWQVTGTDAGVPAGEGFSGAAFGSTGWSLAQQGFSLGNIGVAGDPSTILGFWTLTNNTGSALDRFQVRGLPGSIVFDVVPDIEVTLGSDIGRAFLPNLSSSQYSYSYSDPLSDDLFGTLTVDFSEGLATGSEVLFFADTDALVPLPASLLLLGAGLLVLGRRRPVQW